MSSSSVDVTGVLSDPIPGDVISSSIVGRGSDDHVDVLVSETEAKVTERGGSRGNVGFEKEGLKIDRDSIAMEVDFFGVNDSRADSMNSEQIIGKEDSGRKDNSREFIGEQQGLIDIGGMEGVSSDVLEKSIGEHDSDANNSVEEQQLLSETFHDGELCERVKTVENGKLLPDAEKSVNKDAVRSKTEDAMIKEGIRVSLDKCSGTDGKSSKTKGKFCSSDLVWGKVRSHPWWPGQIIEPGDASEKARKHFRAKSYLVAYFGDHTFAWNDKAKLKPFVPHFEQMVKQTSMDAFQNAVGCVLDEVSRRVEFGLSCHCIDADVYTGLKTQIIENAGVQEQGIVHESDDKSFALLYFEPVQFLDYIRSLALEPQPAVDKLKQVVVFGQISAFYRWKGFYHLPKFEPWIGCVNNEADPQVTKQIEEVCEVVDHKKEAKVILEEQGNMPKKRKNICGDYCPPPKKEKPLSIMMRKLKSNVEESDVKTKGKPGKRSLVSSSNSKEASRSLRGPKTENCSVQALGNTPMTSKDLKPSFRVGESILRVASLLSKPSPLLKLDVGKTKKAKGSSNQTPKQTKVGPAEHSCDEIIYHLLLAAKEPLKDPSMPTSMVNFFSDFRNSVVQDEDISQKHEGWRGRDIVGKSDERPPGSVPSGMDRGCSPGSICTEKASDSEIITTTSDLAAVEDAKLIGTSELRAFSVGSQNTESEHEEEKQQEASPTALTLKFTDIDSIPSEDKLCKIFSHFGPLIESEVKILTKKKCARVVFKRRLDAETAFSSSGKFENFGPALVCYQLADAPSPCRSSSVKVKRRKKEGSQVEENVA